MNLLTSFSTLSCSLFNDFIFVLAFFIVANKIIRLYYCVFLFNHFCSCVDIIIILLFFNIFSCLGCFSDDKMQLSHKSSLT